MPSQKRRIRNKTIKNNLHNEITAELNEYKHDSDSSDDIMKNIRVFVFVFKWCDVC